MPKNRNRKSGLKRVKKRLFIVCEGEKTEPLFFNEFIKDCDFRGSPVEIRVVNTEKNSPKELIGIAKKLREVESDEIWSVLDFAALRVYDSPFWQIRRDNKILKKKNISLIQSSKRTPTN
ncbi:MAG: RloB domain-containing protein [bacterium]|nr:RloB domain-containing protein [bacterium]